jgi:hypothetical protein
MFMRSSGPHLLSLTLALVGVTAWSQRSQLEGAVQVAAASIEYRVLATSKTSSMEKELNEAADAGFRFRAVMGGETAIGGNEVVVVMIRTVESKGRYAYKLLAASKTSTMQKELQEVADAGFEYMGQTVFKSLFGGDEVVVILERDKDTEVRAFEYRLLATLSCRSITRQVA